MAWYDYPIGHGYITQYQGPGTDTPHYADDVETPFHTPITSLFEGDVVKADYQPWGGEVFVRTNVPGLGPTEEYFYHFDQVEVSPGQHVSRGQELGLSGGQTRGGAHPTDPHWSTGPHTHVGFFTKYVPQTGGGSIPYGPDITPWLTVGGTPQLGTKTPVQPITDDCSQYGGWWNPQYWTCKANQQVKMQENSAAQGFLSSVEQSLGVESNTDLLYRAGFIGAGILFIIFGLMIFSRSFMSGVQASASQMV